MTSLFIDVQESRRITTGENLFQTFAISRKGKDFAERYYLEILSWDWWSMFTRIRRQECVSQSTRIGQRLSFRHRQWRVKGMKGRLKRVYIRRNHEMMIIIRTLCKTSLPWLTAMNADSVRSIDDMLNDINDDEIAKDVTWQTIRYTLQWPILLQRRRSQCRQSQRKEYQRLRWL